LCFYPKNTLGGKWMKKPRNLLIYNAKIQIACIPKNKNCPLKLTSGEQFGMYI